MSLAGGLYVVNSGRHLKALSRQDSVWGALSSEDLYLISPPARDWSATLGFGSSVLLGQRSM